MSKNKKLKINWEFWDGPDPSEYGLDPETEKEMIEDLRRSIDREIINKVIEMGNDIIKAERLTTIEEKIVFYDKKYHDNKHSYFFQHMAENGLLNSIYFRTKKILRDYCE